MKKGILVLIIIASIAAGAVLGAFLFRGKESERMKDKVRTYEGITTNLHRENDSLKVEIKRKAASAAKYTYQLDTLQRTYSMLLSSLSFNTSQLTMIKAKYDILTNRRYDTFRSADIRRYFADSLQLPRYSLDSIAQ